MNPLHQVLVKNDFTDFAKRRADHFAVCDGGQPPELSPWRQWLADNSRRYTVVEFGPACCVEFESDRDAALFKLFNSEHLIDLAHLDGYGLNLRNCTQDFGAIAPNGEPHVVLGCTATGPEARERLLKWATCLWNDLSEQHGGLFYRRLPETALSNRGLAMITMRIAPRVGKLNSPWVVTEAEPIRSLVP